MLPKSTFGSCGSWAAPTLAAVQAAIVFFEFFLEPDFASNF